MRLYALSHSFAGHSALMHGGHFAHAARGHDTSSIFTYMRVSAIARRPAARGGGISIDKFYFRTSSFIDDTTLTLILAE